MNFLFQLTLTPRSFYFTWQQYQGFFIGMFIDSKSFQRTEIILLWPRNKTICLIEQFIFFGLRTSHALRTIDKWGQGPRLFRHNGSAVDSEQFECQPPEILGLPFYLCFSVTSLINAPSTKGQGCLDLFCRPCTFIPTTKQLSSFLKPCSRGELGWLLAILHLSGTALNTICENLLGLSCQ